MQVPPLLNVPVRTVCCAVARLNVAVAAWLEFIVTVQLPVPEQAADHPANVETVFGAVGRSDSATDNAPLDMYDTTVMLKPREQWPAGMTYDKLIRAMDEKLQFPGLSNTWTMPVENRLDMAQRLLRSGNAALARVALPVLESAKAAIRGGRSGAVLAATQLAFRDHLKAGTLEVESLDAPLGGRTLIE